MSVEIVRITTPVGRLVSNGLYTPRDKDSDGNPLVFKTGNSAGQPRVEFYAGIAIPKTGVDWKQTEWGAQLIAVARAKFPAMFDPATNNIWQGRDFAFKVQDGDSVVPNTRGNRNCDKEGWPGHWVVFASNGYAPTIVNRDGSEVLTAPIIEAGHYVQARIRIDGNGSTQSPGLYLNLEKVAHSGYGPVIVTGESAAEAGFGAAPLPAGASTTPLGGLPAQNTAPVVQQQQQTTIVTPPVVPAVDLVQPGGNLPPPPPPAVQVEEKFHYNGAIYTKSQLLSSPGWTEAHLVNLPRA